MRKKVAAALVGAAAAVMVLSGCGSDGIGSKSGGTSTSGELFPVKLTDGRTVQCIYLTKRDGYDTATGGPSCDWERAK
jgi:hypothetical protein